MPIYNASGTSSQTPAASANILANSLSTTASKIAPLNTDRKGITIYNSLSVAIYVDSVNSVTSSSYMFTLAAKAYYEMPAPIYTGDMWAICASGTGSVQIRELV